jgi:hypothetical protein
LLVKNRTTTRLTTNSPIRDCSVVKTAAGECRHPPPTTRVLALGATRVAIANSIRSAWPAKPSPEFPLSWHPAGYWCKRHLIHQIGWDNDNNG